MAHLGLICPDMSGHLNPMMSLARELERRGNRVTFYHRPVVQRKIEAAGLTFRAFGSQEFPPEVAQQELRELAEISGIKALRYTIDLFKRRAAICLRDVPDMARADKIDAMLIDQVSVEGCCIANAIDVPFISVSNALMLHPDDRIPPFCFTWPFRTALPWRLRNRAFSKFISVLSRPLMGVINDFRQQKGMKPYVHYWDALSPLLQISQSPREFEYPRPDLPPHFHFVGPMLDSTVREKDSFDFGQLDGRPLIYASMGTLQNRKTEVFGTIAEACGGLPAQAVISLGGAASPEDLGPLPGNPIVVKFAPQLEMLKRASLCITHAGMNTAMESLAQGLPMVAIPITNDQPGVAARIAWTGTGEFVPLSRLTPQRLRAAVERVLAGERYRENAKRLKQAIAQSGGVTLAASMIQIAATGKAVTERPALRPATH